MKKYSFQSLNRMLRFYEVVIWILSYFIFHHVFIQEFLLAPSLKVNLVYTLVFMGYVCMSVFNLRFLVPKYFDKRKYKTFALLAFVLLLLTSFVLNQFSYHVLQFPDHKHEDPSVGWMGFFFVFALIYMGIGVFFYIFSHLQKMHENLINYEKDKIDAELTALKAQINPHLLFNTLNNIYSLSLDKSDKTPEMILKLSDLMSYVLYDCKNNEVLLKNEVHFLENYVALEKIRFEDTLDIKFESNILQDTVSLAPLLFLPFIENAFKHVDSAIQEIAKIRISLKQEREGSIHFTSVNSHQPNEMSDKNPYSGIGIQNIRKRVAYLYPDKYQLDIQELADEYVVNLKIDL